MRPYYSGLFKKLVGSPRVMQFGECQQISTDFQRGGLQPCLFWGGGEKELLMPDFPKFIVLNHTHTTALTFESVQSPR